MGDIWTELANYRKAKTLPNGNRLLLRPLTKEDKQGLMDLFARASKEDLEYFRNDAGDPAVVEGWVDTLDLQRVYPLVAIVNEGDRGGGRTVVGDATLHFGEHYDKHRAWVRIFLDRGHRHQGIGTLMLRSLIEIARNAGLQQLYAEVLANQPRVVKAFEDLGFKQEVMLRDYFITSDEETLDMAILVLRLVDRLGEF